ncbi:hypothetical protein NDU88_000232 [Pleurodeles waltl]|uniref:Uncharacterized protein n=1 Tax=Pleurodeles waltl TaxID=8319 RepID=A0AAV7MJ36_PLEWA|nr:hypothetical protein NDU88_000232 [Pleurodeles waltl]
MDTGRQEARLPEEHQRVMLGPGAEPRSYLEPETKGAGALQSLEQYLEPETKGAGARGRASKNTYNQKTKGAGALQSLEQYLEPETKGAGARGRASNNTYNQKQRVLEPCRASNNI